MDDVSTKYWWQKIFADKKFWWGAKQNVFFLGPSLIFSSTNFFAAKISSLRHQKPKKNVYTVHSKAADPRNSDRLEFLTTLEEDEKILCFGVFCTQNVGFCIAVCVNICFVWIWLDFFSASSSSKAMQLKLAIHCYTLAPYFPMGKPPLTSPVMSGAVDRQKLLAGRPPWPRVPNCRVRGAPNHPKDRVVSCISWMSGWVFLVNAEPQICFLFRMFMMFFCLVMWFRKLYLLFLKFLFLARSCGFCFARHGDVEHFLDSQDMWKGTAFATNKMNSTSKENNKNNNNKQQKWNKHNTKNQNNNKS